MKKRNGNPGKRKLNTSEPSAGTDLSKPKNLNAVASDHWDEVVECLGKMSVLDRADRTAVELLCQTYSEWIECLKLVESEGRILRSLDKLGNEQLSTHPAVRQASDAAKRIKSILCEFGLTPSARVSLGTKDSAGGALDALLTKYSGN